MTSGGVFTVFFFSFVARLVLINKQAIHTKPLYTTMKTATIFASLIASAAAFAPSSQVPVPVSALAATAAELDSLAGKSVEVGGKVVRIDTRYLACCIQFEMISFFTHLSLSLYPFVALIRFILCCFFWHMFCYSWNATF
jgi:hypothetical protein